MTASRNTLNSAPTRSGQALCFAHFRIFLGDNNFPNVPSDPSFTGRNALATGHGRKVNLIRLDSATVSTTHGVFGTAPWTMSNGGGYLSRSRQAVVGNAGSASVGVSTNPVDFFVC